MTYKVEIKKSLANAINAQNGKPDWVTPEDVFRQICDDMNLEPLTDVCATIENTKCLLYISEEQDFFKTDVYTDCYLNAPYLRENKKKGMRGIGNYHARLYYLHITHNIATMSLMPSTVTSIEWFHTYYGSRLINAFGEKAEQYFIKGRVKFLNGKSGAPPFASQVFVHRRKSEWELKQIRQRYDESKDKLLW